MAASQFSRGIGVGQTTFAAKQQELIIACPGNDARGRDGNDLLLPERRCPVLLVVVVSKRAR
jgi:hypothetical protein